jgi:hypothetical protein
MRPAFVPCSLPPQWVPLHRQQVRWRRHVPRTSHPLNHPQRDFVPFGLAKESIFFRTDRKTRGLITCRLDPIAEVIGLRCFSHHRMRPVGRTYAIYERRAQRFQEVDGI